MVIKRFVQMPLDQICGGNYQAIIAASGYESRSRFIPEQLCSASIERRIAVGFNDRHNDVTQHNDRVLTDLDYDIRRGSSGPALLAAEAIRQVKQDVSGDTHIMVDYSSMSRHVLASIVSEYRDDDMAEGDHTVDFVYTAYQFSEPGEPIANEHIGPIPGFSVVLPPNKEIALIIGLGHTKKRALGLVEYIDPAEVFALYTYPPIDNRYIKTIRNNNDTVMQRLGDDHILPYPADDLQSTLHLISSLVDGFSSRYRIILAPIGPKPYALLNLLLAVQNPNLDVWRITAGHREPPVDRKPSGFTLCCRVTFSN